MRAATYPVLLASLLLAAAVLSCPARASLLADFELGKLDNWADAVAVCDVTRFLLIDPDLNADTLVVAGRGNSVTALAKPLYMPPTNFFSEVMRETFENLRKAGQITPDGYNRARLLYASRMIDAYRSATLSEKHVLADQMELCYHLAARTGVKLEMKH
jgi:hypothetical protein